MRRALLASVLLLASCKNGPTRTVELTVHAASSLKEAFDDIEAGFEKANPDIGVAFNLAGSQDLRTQIEHGAPGDVFASADRKHMAALAEVKLAAASSMFTCNDPVVVAPADHPKPATFAELAVTTRIVIGAASVPIGAYTRQILDAASNETPGFREAVEANVVSNELNVRQVLAKVTLGEANAAVVYRTDALSARDSVRVVEIPPSINVRAEYPIAVLSGSKHPAEAQAFVDYVLSAAGQAVFAARGFRSCGAP